MDDTFRYPCNDSPKLFPIDYTQKELSDCFTYKKDPGTIRNNVLEHPFFCLTLKQLRFNPECLHQESIIPVPLEAVPLLKCFYTVAREDKTYTNEILKNQAQTQRSADGAGEIRDSFARDLCLLLCQEVAPKGSYADPDDNAYYRHAVFQNRPFRKVLIGDLFLKELTPRVIAIQELAKKLDNLDVDIQMAMLQNCLLSLDYAILNLKKLSSTISQEEESVLDEEIPSQLLEQLLQSRKQSLVPPGTNHYAEYYVPNSKLSDNIFLKNVFEAKPPLDEDTLLQARKAYLSDLSKRVEITEFERKYFDLQEYLRNTSFDNTKRESILQQCKDSCKNLIRLCTIGLPPSDDYPPQENYNATFIDQLVQSSMSNHFYSFKDLIQLIVFDAGVYFRFPDEIKHSGSFGITEFWKAIGISNSFTHVKSFTNCLQSLWLSLNNTNNPIFDPQTCRFIDLPGFANQLWQEYQTVLQFFPELSTLDFSENEIQQELALCDEILAHPELECAPPLITRAEYKLLVLLFFSHLRKRILSTVEQIIDYTKPLHEMITDYHPTKSKN